MFQFQLSIKDYRNRRKVVTSTCTAAESSTSTSISLSSPLSIASISPGQKLNQAADALLTPNTLLLKELQSPNNNVGGNKHSPSIATTTSAISSKNDSCNVSKDSKKRPTSNTNDMNKKTITEENFDNTPSSKDTLATATQKNTLEPSLASVPIKTETSIVDNIKSPATVAVSSSSLSQAQRTTTTYMNIVDNIKSPATIAVSSSSLSQVQRTTTTYMNNASMFEPVSPINDITPSCLNAASPKDEPPNGMIAPCNFLLRSIDGGICHGD